MTADQDRIARVETTIELLRQNVETGRVWQARHEAECLGRYTAIQVKLLDMEASAMDGTKQITTRQDRNLRYTLAGFALMTLLIFGAKSEVGKIVMSFLGLS